MNYFQEAVDLLSTWKFWAYLWNGGAWLLLIVGILSGLAVTAFNETIGSTKTKILGFISAVCTTVIASASPFDMANRYFSAWRILHHATMEYSYKLDNKLNPDFSVVLNAELQGEAILDQAPKPKLPSQPKEGEPTN